MGKNTFRKIVLLLALVMSGCGSSGVIPMDHGLYMVAVRRSQIGRGAPIGAEADVYKEATTFCAKFHREVETVKFDIQDAEFARPGSATLQFRCIQGADPPPGEKR